MSKKINKTNEVRKHLLKGYTITSLQAFAKWNATRLSSIIFNLRHRELMNIEAVNCKVGDVIFSKYKWKGTIGE